MERTPAHVLSLPPNAREFNVLKLVSPRAVQHLHPGRVQQHTSYHTVVQPDRPFARFRVVGVAGSVVHPKHVVLHGLFAVARGVGKVCCLLGLELVSAGAFPQFQRLRGRRSWRDAT